MSWLPKGFEFLSGFPERLRRKRVILTIQAVFDDSGTRGTGRYMAMSGLLGDAELIASVADDWDRELRNKSPKDISFFKMYHACKRQKCFSGWSIPDRDLKVRKLGSVIDRNDLVRITATIDLQAFELVAQRWNHIKPRRGDLERHHSLGSPYMLLFQRVLVAAIGETVDRGSTTPLEIVYDEQSAFGPTLLEWYPSLRAIERDPRHLAVLPVLPQFKGDLDFVVLQAADLLAGEDRMAIEGGPKNPSFIGELCPHLPLSRYSEDIGETRMEQLHAHLVTSMEREQEAQDVMHKDMTCGD